MQAYLVGAGQSEFSKKRTADTRGNMNRIALLGDKIVVQSLQRFFQWWGNKVALNPIKVILATLLITGLSVLGMLNFSSEADGWKVYLPEGSRHSKVQKWKDEHFVENVRGTITLFTHEENVLSAEAIRLLLDLHQRVRAVQFEGKNYTDACLKVPITNINFAKKGTRRRKREATPIESVTSNISKWETESDDYIHYDDYVNFYGSEWSESDSDIINKLDNSSTLDGLPKDIYCSLVETLQDRCGEFSLLEIWNYDPRRIEMLEDQDVINDINTMDESPFFGYLTNYTSNYLGQVEKNSSGHVVGAKTIRSIWMEQFNPDDIPPTSELAGFEINQADPFTIGFENEVLKVLNSWQRAREKEGKGYSLYMNLGLSYNDEASNPIEYDVDRQIYAYIIMFTYTMLTLGKLNIVETKFYLAAAGILSVFLGVSCAIAIAAALGVQWYPSNGILPFISLGIGIDDMFVILRCFNNIPDAEKKSTGLVKSIGLTMKNAGVSITITSLTDICAFGIGAITYFPAIRSFSITASIAIAIIYIFQSSWFVAWMALDQRRIQQKRNGFFPFMVHEDWQPPTWSQKDIGRNIMSKVSHLFEFRVFQGLVILITCTMVSIGVWGACQIRIDYDPLNLLPEESYLIDWIEQNDINFPTERWAVLVYSQDVPYSLHDFEKIDMIVNGLDNLTKTHNHWVSYGKELPKAIQIPFEMATGFWWQDLKTFITTHEPVLDWREAFAKGFFPLYLSDFLHHKEGSIYGNYFRFSNELSCNVEAPPITAVNLGVLKLRELRGPAQHIPVQNAIKEIITRANMSTTTFAYSTIYAAWEIEEILSGEMYQNISLAILCVTIIVFITLSDLSSCFLIVGCVVFTIVDVVGITYLLGMTIDPMYLHSTVIGIGLSVDYAAHVAHSFITLCGPKKVRVTNAYLYIGPAILHGGTTTMLALSLLAFSESHIFIVFFKIVSLTVVLGLFHGLVFLPVMLILFGSENVQADENDQATSDNLKSDKNTVDNCVTRKGIDNPDFTTDEQSVPCH